MATEPIRWSRLEPRTRDRSLAPGLEVRVHDPLWLLARQWQFGELTADADLGSAVAAKLTAEVAPLTTYRPGRPDDGEPPRTYDPAGGPLETLVEAEVVRAAPTALMRARAGLHFERLLAVHGMERYVPIYRAAYAFGAGTDAPDAASRRFLAVIAGRAPDGGRLYDDLAAALRPAGGGSALALPPAPPVDDTDVSAVRAAAEAWLAWFDTLFAEPPPSARPAWIADRMEYAFGVGAPGQAGSVALEAEEYTDGRLDWHVFSAAAADTPPPGAAEVVGPVTVIPSAVTYPGMPAPRLWEFEDARVDFGDVEADPEDLGRMILTEFALVYGGDWLLVPLEVPVGSLTRVTALEVRDTFGTTVRIGPTSAREDVLGDWRMFGLSATGDGPPADGLLVAPTLAASLQGPALEEVLLLRDETANLAWAIERAVEGENGQPVDRAQTAYEQRVDAAPPPSNAETLAYRLRTDVPENWLPLLPQRLQAGDPAMTLKLGAIPRVLADGTVQLITPLGRLLRPPAAPAADVFVREEEVPREGARVTRAYQLARWTNGSTFLWLGRRKSVGRGEGSSGLRFDILVNGP